MKKVLLLLTMMLVAYFCLAQTPDHPNWVTFERTSPTTASIRWSAEPSANVSYYYTAYHPTTTMYTAPSYCDPAWNGPGDWAAGMTLDSPGVYIVNIGALDPTKEYYAYVAAVETGGWSWSAYSSWEPPILTYDYPEGQLSPIYPDVSLQMITGNANNGVGHPPTPPQNPGSIVEHIQIFDLVGPGPWDMRFTTTLEWIWVVGQGVYHGPIADVHIPAAKNLEIEVQFGSGGDPTLPVELSSFTATLTASSFVTLSWTSQSETNLLGYRLYRSETMNSADAVLITPSMVQATNTSTACTYAHEDHEVAAGTSYWYWLESVDFNSSEMHGPSSVIVPSDPGTPVLPVITSVSDIYPNPFRIGANTNIDVNVKAGDNASLTIYNSRGQAVKTSSLFDGLNQINWNGVDDNGNSCSSGIYYIRVSSNSLSVTKKLVLVK